MRSTRIGLVVCFSALTAAYPAKASSIQKQPPEKIFAAICATCHGPAGTGGLSWIDGSIAPWIAGASSAVIKSYVRRGYGRSMPAFSSAQITEEELDSLSSYLHSQMAGVPPPAVPRGKPVLVDILDADPWFADDMTDNDPDRRRLELSENEYLKVVNTGRTWHTLTNDDLELDAGFIGFSQYRDTGYYYAKQGRDLARGCVAYHCHLHPYMQVEVCSPAVARVPYPA